MEFYCLSSNKYILYVHYFFKFTNIVGPWRSGLLQMVVLSALSISSVNDDGKGSPLGHGEICGERKELTIPLWKQKSSLPSSSSPSGIPGSSSGRPLPLLYRCKPCMSFCGLHVKRVKRVTRNMTFSLFMVHNRLNLVIHTYSKAGNDSTCACQETCRVSGLCRQLGLFTP